MAAIRGPRPPPKRCRLAVRPESPGWESRPLAAAPVFGLKARTKTGTERKKNRKNIEKKHRVRIEFLNVLGLVGIEALVLFGATSFNFGASFERRLCVWYGVEFGGLVVWLKLEVVLWLEENPPQGHKELLERNQGRFEFLLRKEGSVNRRFVQNQPKRPTSIQDPT